MTKQVDERNQIWYEEDGKLVRMGLTRSFLDTLDECWHILPSNMKTIKKRAPLLTIENNDGLISLLSPVTGNLSNWDTKAANFPEKLTENDVIVTLTSDEVQQSPTDAERAAARNRLEEAGIVERPVQAPRPVFTGFENDPAVIRAMEALRGRQTATITGAPWNTVTTAAPRGNVRPQRVNVQPMPLDWLDLPPAQP